eukprot:g1494.t1
MFQMISRVAWLFRLIAITRAVLGEESVSLERTCPGDGLYKKAYDLHVDGQIDEAIKLYEEAVVLDPLHVSSFTNLGNALLGKNRFAEAEAASLKAIQLDPLFFNPHVDLGFLYSITGQLSESETAYRNAISLKPSSASPQTYRGVLFRDMGRFDEAIISSHRALELDPTKTTERETVSTFISSLLARGRPRHDGDTEKASRELFLKLHGPTFHQAEKSPVAENDEYTKNDLFRISRLKFNMMLGSSSGEKSLAIWDLTRIMSEVNKSERQSAAMDFAEDFFRTSTCGTLGVTLSDKVKLHRAIVHGGTEALLHQPLSFDMTNKTEVEMFNVVKSESHDSSRWIVQPGIAYNNKGTYLLKNQMKAPSGIHAIVSRYVEDPVVILGGHKTEIRVFALVKTTDPVVSVHIYNKWFHIKVAKVKHNDSNSNFMEAMNASVDVIHGLSNIKERFIEAVEKRSDVAWSETWKDIENLIFNVVSTGVAATEREETSCEFSMFAFDIVLGNKEKSSSRQIQPYVVDVLTRGAFNFQRLDAQNATIFGIDLLRWLHAHAQSDDSETLQIGNEWSIYE